MYILTQSGSLYEEREGQLRRLHGEHAATKNQGTDGEWRSYHAISPAPALMADSLGACLYIIWDNNPDIHARKITRTTPIVAIRAGDYWQAFLHEDKVKMDDLIESLVYSL